jgi:signal peptidase I
MKKKTIELPSIEALEAEISRKKHKQNQHHLLRNILYALITVAAVTALVAILFMPVLKTYGDSMSPTLEDGELVVVIKTSKAKPGDVIAFYYNNKLFIKRVIASGGALVDMDEEGSIYVDGVLLDEPYLTEKAVGNGDVEFPFEVPDGQYFVLGDNRLVSADSRNSILGCVDPDDMLGRVLACVWPPKNIGKVN